MISVQNVAKMLNIVKSNFNSSKFGAFRTVSSNENFIRNFWCSTKRYEDHSKSIHTATKQKSTTDKKGRWLV